MPQPSIAMAHQIRAVSKERLVDTCGFIKKKETREKIRNAIKLYLDLN